MLIVGFRLTAVFWRKHLCMCTTTVYTCLCQSATHKSLAVLSVFPRGCLLARVCSDTAWLCSVGAEWCQCVTTMCSISGLYSHLQASHWTQNQSNVERFSTLTVREEWFFFHYSFSEKATIKGGNQRLKKNRMRTYSVTTVTVI